MNKRKFLSLSLIAAVLSVLSLTGCATTSPPTIKAMFQGVSSTGAIVLLHKKPAVKPKLEKAKVSLETLVSTGNGDMAQLQTILNDALGGTPEAQILAANLTALVSWVNDQMLHLDQRQQWIQYVKPAAEGLAAGIGQALALQGP